MYSFLSKKYLYSTKLKKDRKKDRGRDSKKETLFWLITKRAKLLNADWSMKRVFFLNFA